MSAEQRCFKYVDYGAGRNALGYMPNDLLAGRQDVITRRTTSPSYYGGSEYISPALTKMSVNANQSVLHGIKRFGLPVTEHNPATAAEWEKQAKEYGRVIARQPGERSNLLQPEVPRKMGSLLTAQASKGDVVYDLRARLHNEAPLFVDDTKDEVFTPGFATLTTKLPDDELPIFNAAYHFRSDGYSSIQVNMTEVGAAHPTTADIWNRLELDTLTGLPGELYPDVSGAGMHSLGKVQIGPQQLRALGRVMQNTAALVR